MQYNELLEYKIQPLYHFTHFVNALEIFMYDRLEARKPKYGDREVIAFTRDFRHAHQYLKDICLVFDRRKLQQKYKFHLTRGDWLSLTQDISKVPNNHKYKEFEERIVYDLPDLHKYLVRIIILRKDNNITPHEDAVLRYSEKYNIPVKFYNQTISNSYQTDNISIRGSTPRKDIGLTEEMLEEEQVLSSWIDELTLEGNNVLMTLLSGAMYIVTGVGEDLYDEWIDAPSKGKFWHSNIRDLYDVYRI